MTDVASAQPGSRCPAIVGENLLEQRGPACTNLAHSRTGKRQTAVAAAGLVRTHSCLSTSRVLRRNSSGLPSATATYTALRKAAAGGSLIPKACQPNTVHNQQCVLDSGLAYNTAVTQHLAKNLQQDGVSVPRRNSRRSSALTELVRLDALAIFSRSDSCCTQACPITSITDAWTHHYKLLHLAC